MKTFIYFLFIFACIFCLSCTEEPLLEHESPLEFESDIDEDAAMRAPAYDVITFENPGFRSFVFYDDIRGPDGLHALHCNKLFVVKEFESDMGVYLATRGTSYDVSDAFSTVNEPFINPDDMTADFSGNLYVADGQAKTVFKVSRNGGVPVPFVTQTSTGSPSFNPFGVAIVPFGFNGPNVNPGDLIVCDNSGSDETKRAVWAVNRFTGEAKIIIQGDPLDGGPIRAAFNSKGILYISLNRRDDPNKLIVLKPDGKIVDKNVEIDAPFFAIHPLSDEIYYKEFDSSIEEGFIYKMSPKFKNKSLFASKVGWTRAGTQDMVFNRWGTRLYISHRNDSKVIEIHGRLFRWLR